MSYLRCGLLCEAETIKNALAAYVGTERDKNKVLHPEALGDKVHDRGAKPKNINTMKATILKNVKKGDFFTFKPIEEPTPAQVYIREEYDRSSRKYGYTKFNDINHWGERKGSTVVYVDFYF